MDKKEVVITKEDSIWKDEMYCEWFSCPECGDTYIARCFNYCPNCGLKIIFKD